MYEMALASKITSVHPPKVLPWGDSSQLSYKRALDHIGIGSPDGDAWYGFIHFRSSSNSIHL